MSWSFGLLHPWSLSAESGDSVEMISFVQWPMFICLFCWRGEAAIFPARKPLGTSGPGVQIPVDFLNARWLFSAFGNIKEKTVWLQTLPSKSRGPEVLWVKEAGWIHVMITSCLINTSRSRNLFIPIFVRPVLFTVFRSANVIWWKLCKANWFVDRWTRRALWMACD